MYKAGTVLKLNFGAFYHYGVADGLGNVIHNSKKHLKVTKESYDDFSEGKPILVSNLMSDEPEKAVARAERYIGMPYDLIKANCEHFARLCHGLEIESTQLQQYMLLALGAGLALNSDNTYVKSVGGAVALSSLLTPTEESPFKNASVATLLALGLVALSKS